MLTAAVNDLSNIGLDLKHDHSRVVRLFSAIDTCQNKPRAVNRALQVLRRGTQKVQLSTVDTTPYLGRPGRPGRQINWQCIAGHTGEGLAFPQRPET